jgi:hypothetical protein
MTKTIWAVVGICIVATLGIAVALVVVLSGGDDGPEPEPQAAPLQVGEGQAPGGARGLPRLHGGWGGRASCSW